MLRRVDASVYIKASRALVFSILEDLEAYREWVPDVTDSRIYASEAEVTVAGLMIPAFGRAKLILEFVESSPEWIVFHQVDRLREDGLSGRWDLAEADESGAVVVTGKLTLRSSVLDLRGRRRLLDVLRRTLDALKTRALRLASDSGVDEVPRLILDLRTVGDMVELELEDRVFRLRLDGESTSP